MFTIHFPGSGAPSPTVAPYEPQLNAFHRAFEKELRQMIHELPLNPGDRVLDLGCGDGFYTGLLADRVGTTGRVTAADSSSEYLKLAQSRLKNHPHENVIQFVKGSVSNLPFEQGEFDFVWCAQSLYSFPHPVAALREMRRVTRLEGIIAIMENDTLHEVILPWPPFVELRLRTVELEALAEKKETFGKYYVGRNLKDIFRRAGINLVLKRSFSRDRLAPLDDHCRFYLESYIKDLKERVWPHMNNDDHLLCGPFLDPESKLYVLNNPTFCATFIDHLVWGKKTPGRRIYDRD